MIKTFISHFISEFAIEAFFNNVINNFPKPISSILDKEYQNELLHTFSEVMSEYPGLGMYEHDFQSVVDIMKNRMDMTPEACQLIMNILYDISNSTWDEANSNWEEN